MVIGIDDLLISGAVSGGISALGNFATGLYAARQAKRINEETYDRFKKIAQDYENELKGLVPPGTVDPITLRDFKLEVSKYIPEIAQHIPEATPQQITESRVAPEIQAQKQALQQYGRLAQAGYDPIAAAQQEQALTAGAAQASAARQAALREAAQRGMGGTGLDVLAGMGAGEQAGVAGRQAALQAQQEAGQRRLQALGAYGNLAGQMRQAGTQTEQANVNVMNAFNERMARNLNQYNQYVAELKDKANLQNRAEQQRIGEMNIDQANKLKILNQQRMDAAAQARQEARERMATTKYKMQAGLGETYATMKGQELSKDVLPWQQGFSTAGKVSDTMLNAYYRRIPEDKGVGGGSSLDDTENQPYSFSSKMKPY